MPDSPPSLDPVQLGAYFDLIEVASLADLLGPVRSHMRSTPPRSAAPRPRSAS
ncbi:hypothetical protein [Actinophytocola xanthii]|uniref:hypothetical protein n=1 Tax=Actinophytocola xanthii TaxID=1912961 RepID=UPI000AF9E43E|nr:hypothetical protein [Actinophytocola xanthii]